MCVFLGGMVSDILRTADYYRGMNPGKATKRSANTKAKVASIVRQSILHVDLGVMPVAVLIKKDHPHVTFSYKLSVPTTTHMSVHGYWQGGMLSAFNAKNNQPEALYG